MGRKEVKASKNLVQLPVIIGLVRVKTPLENKEKNGNKHGWGDGG
jgi:hypothetical protein